MIGWWYVVVCACIGGASSLIGYMFGERASRAERWGLDHRGRPMRHPPCGDCYCKIPGDGHDRCPVEQHKGDSDG